MEAAAPSRNAPAIAALVSLAPASHLERLVTLPVVRLLALGIGESYALIGSRRARGIPACERAADIAHAAVHPALLIGEHPVAGDPAGHPFHGGVVIATLHAHERQKPGIDRADHPAGNPHFRRRYPLQ